MAYRSQDPRLEAADTGFLIDPAQGYADGNFVVMPRRDARRMQRLSVAQRRTLLSLPAEDRATILGMPLVPRLRLLDDIAGLPSETQNEAIVSTLAGMRRTAA